MPGAPLRLRCEFINNPIGVTRLNPRLSWWVNDPRPAELQTAYEIQAATTVSRLEREKADLWQSGLVESDQNTHVAYGGPNLSPHQQVWWRVRTYDSDGLVSPWSEPASFQSGLLYTADWQGAWIAGHLRASPSRGVQAVAMRHEFVVDRPIRAATLYVCALGDYRLEINGRRLPGVDSNAVWSDFDQRAYYQAFDVAQLLLQEPNCIGVLLADGYFAGELAGLGRSVYGDRPQLKLQLHINLQDGTQQIVLSDESWRWCPSWILAADINGGEHVDARQFVEGWSEPGLDDSRWMPVDVLPDQDVELLWQPYPGLAIKQVLRPLNLPLSSRRDDRIVSVYDFGDALLGRVQVDILSKACDNIVLTYGLSADFAEATNDSYMSAAATGGEIFTGQFALHGFRYLRIEYTSHTTKIGNVSALRIAPWESQSLNFRSDHPNLNALFEALHNSQRAVALSLPLAGLLPHSRRADLGLAGAWLPLYAQQVQSRALVGKWLEDWLLPTVVVSDDYMAFETTVATVWNLYRYHNDLEQLQTCYPSLRVAALSYRHRFGKLLREDDLGEVYGAPRERRLVATATLYGALDTMVRIASVLNRLGDLELLTTLKEDVRHAFRMRFLTGDGNLVAESQSAFVAALYFPLLEPAERVVAQQGLTELVQAEHYHTDVAPRVMHALLPVLTDAGRLDLAYMVLLQTSAPSWLANLDAGNQLLGREPGQFNVADLGLWEWLLEALIGIRLSDELGPGGNAYRFVHIRPLPPLGKLFLAGSPVQFVEAGLQTPQGNFEVKWWINEDGFELELLIPPGSAAVVTLPDGIDQPVQSGRHRFMMGFDAGGDGVPILLDLASPDIRAR